jgi:hypothetical protein
VIQALVDADNLTPARLEALLRALPLDDTDLVVAGSRHALSLVRWPARARMVEVEGWQQADVALVTAYRPGDHALVIASGDGDFAHLALAHRGPVLVVSDRPASALRRAGTVVDPVTDGVDALRHWFDAVLD